MESTSSSASPFQRIAQPHTIDTSTGNVPRRVFRAKEPFNRFTPIFGLERVVHLTTKWMAGCAFPNECKRSMYRIIKIQTSRFKR
ncbi:hypothetical protein H5410_037029 [Solanum commersonii]|uniref:Uncharacterized protein n=1 Tax=Solanum commersonii TaxID=4109 RepID=A0A9J5Y6L6_SOLCO|nr:hypothetical protein H5410_037029 [Solanum commersonii]